MKTIELDTEYLSNLSSLIAKIKFSGSYMTTIKAVVAGGAIRDMLFNKPVSDIDVFYEGELKNLKLEEYFKDIKTNTSSYPDGFNVTHNLTCSYFPIPIQLIQVKDIDKHINTFPCPASRVWFDYKGIHGLDMSLMEDFKVKHFFWDQKVDLSYFLKIKTKYSDWDHEFEQKQFNPELEMEMVF